MILLATAAAILSAYVTLGRQTVFKRAGQDFGILYRSLRQHEAGRSLYDSDFGTGQREWRGRNLNLPHTHVVLLPLAWLLPSPAIFVWLALSALALVDTCRRTYQMTDIRFRWLGILTLAVYLIAWAPTAAMVLTFQVSLLVMWPVASAWLYARRGNWGRAGLLIGLAASVKPFLLICLPYFAIRRQWSAFVRAVATVAVMVALGLAVFGVESYKEWLRQAGEITWRAHYMNASFLGVLERCIGHLSGYARVARAPELVVPLAIVASGLLGLLTLWRITPADHSPERIDSEWAAWLLASLLMSPVGWVYYVWLALPPLVVVVARAAPWVRKRPTDFLLLFGVVALLWFGSMTEWGQPDSRATVTSGSMYFWALFALWGWTVSETTRSRAGGSR